MHYPAAFYTALLNNQPMGFYHPSTLVKDAQRRGVRFHKLLVIVEDRFDAIMDEIVGEVRARNGEIVEPDRLVFPQQ